jgi:hypothetical protein
MSLELHILMHDSRVPTRAAWQHAIEQKGFPTVLDATLDLRQAKGYAPTTYAGQSTGFELFLEPAREIVSAYPHIAERVGPRDMCATFRWGGDVDEMCAALSAAAALTKLTDGMYFWPADDILYGADEALEATRRDLSSV